MKPGFGSRLRDSRIKREHITWSNGTLGLVPFGHPQYQEKDGRLTSRTGSAQDRINFQAGLTSHFFTQPKEAPTGTQVVKSPVHIAYAELVSPQNFWDPDPATLHFYRSGGVAATFDDPVGPRVDSMCRGLYYMDERGLPYTRTDLLSPGSPSGVVENTAKSHFAHGSAFDSLLGSVPGGSGFRSQNIASKDIPLPWYASVFFKTTRSSFNFFGAYQVYEIMKFSINATDFWAIQLGNTTQTIGGTDAVVRIKKQSVSTVITQTHLTQIVNDGEWHHVFFWARGTNDIEVFLDGVSVYTNVVNTAESLDANGARLSEYFFNGLEGQLGFAAIGDATNVTADRIKVLAATRTLPDRVVAPTPTGYAYADTGQRYYDATDVTWHEAVFGPKVYEPAVTGTPALQSPIVVNGTSGSSTSVTLPSWSTGIGKVGTILVAAAVASNTPNLTTPAGYTYVTDFVANSSSRIYLFRKSLSDSDSGATVTLSWDASNRIDAAAVVAFDTVFDTFATQGQGLAAGGLGGAINIPAVTPNGPVGIAAAFYGGRSNTSDVSSVISAHPSGYTDGQAHATTTGGAVRNIVIGASIKAFTGGTIAATTATSTSSDASSLNSRHAIHVSLLPIGTPEVWHGGPKAYNGSGWTRLI